MAAVLLQHHRADAEQAARDCQRDDDAVDACREARKRNVVGIFVAVIEEITHELW